MTGRGDRGFALPELLVTIALVATVTLVVGGLFVSTAAAGRTIRTTTIAASEAQAASSIIATAVSNASHVRLITDASGDQTLQVRVAGGGATLSWTCRAWHWSASGGVLRQTAWSPHATPPDASAGGIVATGVAPGLPAAPATSTAVFSQPNPDTLDIAFTGETDGTEQVRISTTATRPRYEAVAGSEEECWT